MTLQKSDDEHSIFQTNKWLFFLFLCLATLCLLIIKKTFIENQTAAFEILESRGEMGIFHTINTLQYLSIPVVYLIKLLIISFVIWVGCFMFGYKVSYGQVWQVAVISEAIFIIPELLKILWFLFVDSDPTLTDIRTFYPLSLINLVDAYELDKRWLYPLKALNIFEIAYWFVLMEGIHTKARKKRKIANAIVLSSYSLFFIFWLIFYTIVYK